MKMIGLADSGAGSASSIHGYAESVRKVHSVGLPCDFPVKIWLPEFFHKSWDVFAVVFLKIMLCFGFW